MKQIEDTFKDFTTREDIAIVLIVQFVRLPPACRFHVIYAFTPPDT